MAEPTRDPRRDQDLVRAINAGDANAFDALYFRYRDWVVRLATRLTGHGDDALDVTALASAQCTWIDSQKKVQTLMPPGAVVRTDILATCPFVTFAGLPVPN